MKIKILSSVLALALAAGCMTCSVSAADEDTGYKLLYENTFDNGAAGGAEAFNKETEYFNLTLNASKTGWNTVNFEGNTGVATNTGAWPADRTILFDFTKGGTQSAANGGIYKLSFDFSSSSNGGDHAWIGQDFSNHYSGARIMGTGKTDGSTYFGTTKSTADWGENNKMALDNSKKYHVESIINLNTKIANTYVDGTLLGATANLHNPMSNFTISMCAYWDYFDNLRLEYYDNMAMEMSIANISYDRISLEFTDGMANKEILNNGAVIKNIYTGEEIKAGLNVVGDKIVDVIPESYIISGYTYKLIFPEGLKGNEGGVLSENSIEFNSAESFAIKSLKLKNLLGDQVDFAEENPAEIQSIIFEFTDDVDGESALPLLSIADSENNNVKFEIKGEKNIGEAVLTDALKGNEVYTLTLNGLEVPYVIKLKTMEGKIAFFPAKLYKADGVTEINSLDDISDGDEIIASFETVNTSSNAVKYFSSIAMYNGRLMTGVNFERVELLPGSKKTTEFSFTIADKTDLKFAGKLWDSENVWPITDEVKFEIN